MEAPLIEMAAPLIDLEDPAQEDNLIDLGAQAQ